MVQESSPKFLLSWKDAAIAVDFVIDIVLNRYSSVLPFGVVVCLVILALSVLGWWIWHTVANEPFLVHLRVYPLSCLIFFLVVAWAAIEGIMAMERKLHAPTVYNSPPSPVLGNVPPTKETNGKQVPPRSGETSPKTLSSNKRSHSSKAGKSRPTPASSEESCTISPPVQGNKHEAEKSTPTKTPPDLPSQADRLSQCKSFDTFKGGSITNNIIGMYAGDPSRCFIMDGTTFDHNGAAIVHPAPPPTSPPSNSPH